MTTAPDDNPSPPDQAAPAGSAPAARPLGQLLAALGATVPPGHDPDRLVTEIVTRGEDVRPDALFVALPGTSADGHAFIADAARRGAAAIVVERNVGGALSAPLVRVPNSRRALAELAAEWYGRPADGLSIIGITGTAGKTSTLSMLERALLDGGARVATIGSLGLHIQGQTREETVYTTPDPLVLHQELARLVAEGCTLVAMEATSHALVQDRVHGLRFRLGIFTNLLPLEHSEYHATFQDYVEAKSLFFGLLEPDAPVVYNHDDPATRALVEKRAASPVGVGSEDGCRVTIRDARTSVHGSRLTLEWDRALPGMGGGSVPPGRLELRSRLLGRSNQMNIALAAVAALQAGTDPESVARAVAAFEPPPRRLEVVHQGRITILDDTVGHPESITSFFEVVERLDPRRVHVAYAVRGQRGDRINRANGQALAIWADRVNLGSLVVTRSAEAADDLNRVEQREYDAFIEPLRERGVPFREIDQLEPAVRAVLDAAGEGDLVALLGAQGMNGGQDVAREWVSQAATA